MSLLTAVHGRGTTAAKPAAAAANEGYIYFDTDLGKLQRSNGATWQDISETASGSVATDAIWDAAGDLAVGTGANTAAKLAIGSTGQVAKVVSGTVAWGTAGEFATQYASVATGETTTSTTYADLTTVGPSVTLTVGASLLVKVSLRCRIANNTDTKYSAAGVVISGANTVAATTLLIHEAARASTLGAEFGASKIFALSATGSTTFKMQYAVEAGTGTFTNREIIVEPVL